MMPTSSDSAPSDRFDEQTGSSFFASPEGDAPTGGGGSGEGGGAHAQGDQAGGGGDRPKRKRGGRRRGRGKGKGDGQSAGEGGSQSGESREGSHGHGRGGHRGGGGGGGNGGGGGSQRTPHMPVKRVRKPAAPLSEKSRTEIFDTETTFASLGLTTELVETLAEIGFVHPTSIQSKLIPVILQGKDVLGQARTGTGKTAAFALPVLDRIIPKSKGGKEFQALVLVPTRELAIQVATDFYELGEKTGLTALPIYGGQNISTQAQSLARGPEVLVATPGRIMDMVERGYIHYRNIRMAVLDEVDRMLDIGFRDDIRRILKACPAERQTIFVSATISGEVESLARSFAPNAEKIVATSGSLTAAMVKQFYLAVAPWDKRSLLRHLLTHESPALTVVFCRMKRTVDEVTESLNRHGIEAHAMHGDMYQNKRNKVIEQLRAGNLSVLVASDLASRGLDIDGITHVINYDLPEDPDLYVHRIGRTARAGRDGVAWSLVTPEQGGLLTEIELLINAEIPKLDYPDFKPGPVPKHVQQSRESDEKRVEAARSVNRFASAPVATNSQSNTETVDPSRFPGGIVPSKLPDRRLGGRVKTARSMKAAITQNLNSGMKPDSSGQPPEKSS